MRSLWIAYGELFPPLELLDDVAVIGTDQSNPPWEYRVPEWIKLITPGNLPREKMRNVTSTVEHCWGLIMAAHRSLPEAVRHPHSDRNDWMVPWQLRGKNLGIIGYGRIGQAVAQVGGAFGMHTRACDIGLSDDPILRDAVIKDSHVVVVATSPEAQNVLGPAPDFCSDAILVSVAPWPAVGPTKVVAEWLDTTSLRAFATDQLEPGTTIPARLSPRFIATPHIGGSTIESRYLVRQYVMEAMAEELARGS